MNREIVADHRSMAHEGILAASLLNGPRVTNKAPTSDLKKIIEVTRLMRKQGDLMTPQAFQIVLEIALQPGLTMQNLETRTGLALASISRNLMALGEWHRLGKPGLNMVETVDDPNERRRKIAFLTKKGREFVEDIMSHQCGDRVHIDAPTSREYLSRAYSANAR